MLLQPPKPDGPPPHTLLVDFGIAEIFEEKRGGQGGGGVKGTPAYLAPEGFEGRLTSKSDLWSVGVMLFEMMLLRRPFKGSTNVFVLYCEVANTEPSLEEL